MAISLAKLFQGRVSNPESPGRFPTLAKYLVVVDGSSRRPQDFGFATVEELRAAAEAEVRRDALGGPLLRAAETAAEKVATASADLDGKSSLAARTIEKAERLTVEVRRLTNFVADWSTFAKNGEALLAKRRSELAVAVIGGSDAPLSPRFAGAIDSLSALRCRIDLAGSVLSEAEAQLQAAKDELTALLKA